MITSSTKGLSRPAINVHRKRIVLAHGGGGQLMDELLDDLIRPRLENHFPEVISGGSPSRAR